MYDPVWETASLATPDLHGEKHRRRVIATRVLGASLRRNLGPLVRDLGAALALGGDGVLENLLIVHERLRHGLDVVHLTLPSSFRFARASSSSSMACNTARAFAGRPLSSNTIADFIARRHRMVI